MNTKPGARKGKKAGKKKKDDPAVEHEDLDDDEEQAQHTQEVEGAAGESPFWPASSRMSQQRHSGLINCYRCMYLLKPLAKLCRLILLFAAASQKRAA